MHEFFHRFLKTSFTISAMILVIMTIGHGGVTIGHAAGVGSTSKGSGKKTPFLPHCSYHIKKADLEWTGFKTTDKVPVRGTFKKIDYEAGKASTPLGVIKKAKFKISTSTVTSGDSLRDQRLAKKFFALMVGDISGEVTGVTPRFSLRGQPKDHLKDHPEDHSKGIIQLKLTMNGQSRPLKLRFQFKDPLSLRAQGKMNIFNFKGTKALNILSEECKNLHKGKDGISKTWSEVGLKVEIELEKTCL